MIHLFGKATDDSIETSPSLKVSLDDGVTWLKASYGLPSDNTDGLVVNINNVYYLFTVTDSAIVSGDQSPANYNYTVVVYKSTDGRHWDIFNTTSVECIGLNMSSYRIIKDKLFIFPMNIGLVSTHSQALLWPALVTDLANPGGTLTPLITLSSVAGVACEYKLMYAGEQNPRPLTTSVGTISAAATLYDIYETGSGDVYKLVRRFSRNEEGRDSTLGLTKVDTSVENWELSLADFDDHVDVALEIGEHYIDTLNSHINYTIGNFITVDNKMGIVLFTHRMGLETIRTSSGEYTIQFDVGINSTLGYVVYDTTNPNMSIQDPPVYTKELAFIQENPDDFRHYNIDAYHANARTFDDTVQTPHYILSKFLAHSRENIVSRPAMSGTTNILRGNPEPYTSLRYFMFLGINSVTDKPFDTNVKQWIISGDNMIYRNDDLYILTEVNNNG